MTHVAHSQSHECSRGKERRERDDKVRRKKKGGDTRGSLTES